MWGTLLDPFHRAKNQSAIDCTSVHFCVMLQGVFLQTILFPDTLWVSQFNWETGSACKLEPLYTKLFCTISVTGATTFESGNCSKVIFNITLFFILRLVSFRKKLAFPRNNIIHLYENIWNDALSLFWMMSVFFQIFFNMHHISSLHIRPVSISGLLNFCSSRTSHIWYCFKD